MCVFGSVFNIYFLFLSTLQYGRAQCVWNIVLLVLFSQWICTEKKIQVVNKTDIFWVSLTENTFFSVRVSKCHF